MTTYYEIDDKCFKPYGDNRPCLHWAFDTYDAKPRVYWSTEILGGFIDNKDSNNQKYNPTYGIT
jgi:hypothetical protein